MKFLKRSYIVILLIILIPFSTKGDGNLIFPDIPQSHENSRAINYLHQKGIINGYPDGLFQPDREINRAEATKIILLAKSVGVRNFGPSQFNDVFKDQWFFNHVHEAKTRNIISGYNDGSFQPEKIINYSESMKMVLATFMGDNIKRNRVKVFEDVPGTEWFSKYFAAGKKKQLIQSNDDNKVFPFKNMTRGEFAELVYRTKVLSASSQSKFNISQSSPLLQYLGLGLEMNLPANFEIVDAKPFLILWKKDSDFGFNNFFYNTKNSSLIVIHMDNNPKKLNRSSYFNQIKNTPPTSNTVFSEANLNGYPILVSKHRTSKENIKDIYMYVSTSKILSIHTSYGVGGKIEGQLKYIMEDTIGSIKFKTSLFSEGQKQIDITVPSKARMNILIKDLGQDTLNLFSDLIIIETDAIGRGNGPVDYYYSEIYDLTLKLDRNMDVIVDIQEGRTSGF